MKKLSKNEFGLAHFAVVALIVLALAISATGIYVYKSNKKTEPTTSSSPVINNESEKNEEPKSTTSKGMPTGWVEYKDAKTGVSFYHPKNIEGKFEVSEYKATEYIAFGFGSPFWIKYDSKTDEWQTYGIDQEKSTAGKIVKKPVKSDITLTTNKVGNKATIYFKVGEGGSEQSSIIFTSGGKLYRIFFPEINYRSDTSNAEEQDDLQYKSIEQLIKTIQVN